MLYVVFLCVTRCFFFCVICCFSLLFAVICLSSRFLSVILCYLLPFESYFFMCYLLFLCVRCCFLCVVLGIVFYVLSCVMRFFYVLCCYSSELDVVRCFFLCAVLGVVFVSCLVLCVVFCVLSVVWFYSIRIYIPETVFKPETVLIEILIILYKLQRK